MFENTQEAIIDQETFDNVQRIRSNVRRYPDGWGEALSLIHIWQRFLVTLDQHLRSVDCEKIHDICQAVYAMKQLSLIHI